MGLIRNIKPIWIVIFGVFLVAVVVFGIRMIIPKASEGPKPQIHQATPPMVNLSIGGNKGDIRVSAISISSISSGVITATGIIQDKTITFVIKTDRDTIVRQGTATSSLSKLEKGDILTVAGTLETFGEQMVLTAKDIRALGSSGTTQYQGAPRKTAPAEFEQKTVPQKTKATSTSSR